MNNVLYVAQQALARGHFDEAMSALEAAQRKATGKEQAKLKLHVASLYALCRAKGLEGALLFLNEAVECDAQIVETALYKALAWQLAAYQGEPLSRVRQGLAQVLSSGQLLPQFHAADALIAAGGFRRAERLLTLLTGLPEHLEWRRASLMGEVHINKADWRGALRYYTKSVQLCKGSDIQAELLSLAECWLHLSAPDNALTLLSIKELADATILEESRIRKGYISGLSYLMMQQPKRALEAFLEVYSLATERGQASFDLLYQMSKAFAACGQYEQAAAGYSKALEASSQDMLPFVLHAYGVTLAELGKSLEAKAELSKVVTNESYPYYPAAMIDLAEILLQLGDIEDAERLAKKTLESPESASACLCLAKIALEYFREDEAVSWLERAIADSEEGEEVWIAAQVLLADTLVQMHGSPQRIIDSSQKALKFLLASDEWTIILQNYVTRFEQDPSNPLKFMN
jgi:tetratricopeptide (TPR) repeat protein